MSPMHIQHNCAHAPTQLGNNNNQACFGSFRGQTDNNTKVLTSIRLVLVIVISTVLVNKKEKKKKKKKGSLCPSLCSLFSV